MMAGFVTPTMVSYMTQNVSGFYYFSPIVLSSGSFECQMPL